MEQWLKSDLAATRAHCILAYWHHPRFFTLSLRRVSPKIDATDRKMAPFWADLQAAGADLVALRAPPRLHERFARQDADGQADPGGMRQFVVGTGGGPPDFFEGSTAPNSEVRKQDTFGVLQLTLHADSYDWRRFVPVAGDPFSDSGSDTCGSAPGPAGPRRRRPPEPAPSVAGCLLGGAGRRHRSGAVAEEPARQLSPFALNLNRLRPHRMCSRRRNIHGTAAKYIFRKHFLHEHETATPTADGDTPPVGGCCSAGRCSASWAVLSLMKGIGWYFASHAGRGHSVRSRTRPTTSSTR